MLCKMLCKPFTPPPARAVCDLKSNKDKALRYHKKIADFAQKPDLAWFLTEIPNALQDRRRCDTHLGRRIPILGQLAKVASPRTQLVYGKMFALLANLANSIARVGQVGPVEVAATWSVAELINSLAELISSAPCDRVSQMSFGRRVPPCHCTH